MRTAVWSQLNTKEQSKLLQRPALADPLNLKQQVMDIIKAVRQNGDQALLDFSKRFDHAMLSSLRVNRDAIEKSYQLVSKDDITVLQRARQQIAAFHQLQRPKTIAMDTAVGIRCEKRPIAIERVGLYVPGGTAPLISTVFMLAVPAEIAGCAVRILATPPRPDGTINPHILVAADLCGVTDIFAVGGAQAIAAMAYGTATIPKVDKLFGPGNAWVTEAKLAVSQDPQGAALDMPAGPSEVLVVVDEQSDAVAAAADLLSQAEHGSDSQVLLVSTCPKKAKEIQAEIASQLASLSRGAIAREALDHSLIFLTDQIADALTIVNQYAPEHLILLQRDARWFADQVRNAGSIFIGPWTPESVGDYASGTNHVLPTYGYARSYSGLGTEAFMKFITYQELTPRGLFDIGPTVERLATLEGLDAHRKAVSVRLAKLQKEGIAWA